MDDSTDAACATDAVRYLYLARVAERLGHAEAAQRWYRKADRWLENSTPGIRSVAKCAPQANSTG